MKIFQFFIQTMASFNKRMPELHQEQEHPPKVGYDSVHQHSRNDVAAEKDAVAKLYRLYGPRVARSMVRNIRQKNSSTKEDHTCAIFEYTSAAV